MVEEKVFSSAGTPEGSAKTQGDDAAQTSAHREKKTVLRERNAAFFIRGKSYSPEKNPRKGK